MTTRTWSYVNESVSSGKTSGRTKSRIHSSFSSNSGSVEKSQAIVASFRVSGDWCSREDSGLALTQRRTANQREGSATSGPHRATTVSKVPTPTPLTLRTATMPPPPQAPLSTAERAVIAAAEPALLDGRRLLTGEELTALAH